jgi:hypothetical protein
MLTSGNLPNNLNKNIFNAFFNVGYVKGQNPDKYEMKMKTRYSQMR